MTINPSNLRSSSFDRHITSLRSQARAVLAANQARAADQALRLSDRPVATVKKPAALADHRIAVLPHEVSRPQSPPIRRADHSRPNGAHVLEHLADDGDPVASDLALVGDLVGGNAGCGGGFDVGDHPLFVGQVLREPPLPLRLLGELL
ncbi:hypothetical protein EHH60_01865 [Bradyrhizobium sp. RP6]|nr:hypothetical protein EHH60_01865 [Bradyrhizobium sp. RP6]